MTPHDRTRFVEIVVGMAALYDRDIVDQAIELYWHAMKRWSIDQFAEAAELLIRRCQFMPRPADFEQLRHAAQPSAGEAWPRVLTHCRGAYRDGSGLDDGGPIDSAVAALGGYRAIAFTPEQYLGPLERRFADRYEEATDSAAVREALPALAGRALPAIDGPDR